MTTYKIGYFVGSLATASINRLLATALVRLAPPELQMIEIPFKDLPLYSYDYDTAYPPVAIEFKNAINAVDAVLFVTPEYNRSIPGGLKNAIDWASRPYGQNAFTRKPSAVIGASPGKVGTAIGQQHLRSILGFLRVAATADRSLHPVHAGAGDRRRHRPGREDEGVPAQLPGRVLRLHRQGLHRLSAA